MLSLCQPCSRYDPHLIVTCFFPNRAHIQHVKLSSYEALKGFLTHVPRSYFHHIQRLDLSTMISKPTTAAYTDTPHPRTDAVVSLLSSCSRLEYLSLELSGGLARHAIPCFSHLPVLKELSISNWGPEESMPM